MADPDAHLEFKVKPSELDAFGQHIENWQHEVVDRLGHSEWTGTAAGHANTRIQFLGNELQAAKQDWEKGSPSLIGMGKAITGAPLS
ncbi:hypothetical protein [Kitasatospora sp. NPDC001683]